MNQLAGAIVGEATSEEKLESPGAREGRCSRRTQVARCCLLAPNLFEYRAAPHHSKIVSVMIGSEQLGTRVMGGLWPSSAWSWRCATGVGARGRPSSTRSCPRDFPGPIGEYRAPCPDPKASRASSICS